MGQVYQATDTTLNRQVALKILPEAFALDPDRLARFQREAQVLASLNHPNIGQIYGLEEAEGQKALVLELIEGPTLADRIKQGPIPVEEALPIAKQIAEALEGAHEQGIIHRDLKPANIKVKGDGTVKVLDFGLAKAFEPEAGSVSASMSPTISLTAAATQMGMVMGTAAYMAPEQAKGLPVDKRADIWAYGAVLFEMLTGKKLFEAGDVSEMLASVLVKDPDVSSIGPHVPAHVRSVVRRCLVKDPRKRLRDIGDVRLAMEDVFEAESAGAEPTPASQLRVWQRPTPLVVAAMALIVAGGLAVWTLTRTASPTPQVITRSTISSPAADLQRGGHPDLTFSPDGQTLVYVALDDGVHRLYRRPLDQLEAVPIPNTDGAVNPFFSPNGEWLAFAAGDVLKKVDIRGGPAVTICELSSNFRVGTWAPDDTIIFGMVGEGLWQVPGTGGEPRPFLELEGEETEHRLPEVLPGGRAVIFNAWSAGEDPGAVAVHSMDTGERRILVEGTNPHYLPTGHLVFAREQTLWAVPFNLDQLTLDGEPVPVVEQVQMATGGGAQAAFASNGSLVYAGSGSGGGPRTLVWVDRDGAQEAINVPPRAYTYARLSPDGGRIALDSRDEENDIWIWDVERETLQRLTRDPGLNRGPVWSPDGRRIAFTAVRDGTESIHWQSADGSGAPEPLSTEISFPFGFTPDGSRLLFGSLAPPHDLGILDVDGSGQATLLADQSYDEENAQISPDSRWLAYQSDESGQNEIFVRPFPDVDSALYPVSTAGGSRPRWSSGGDELFYYVNPGTIMTVPVDSGAELVLGRPEVAVQGAYARPRNTGTHYDVSPDGRRFLLIVEEGAPEGESTAPQITLVLNWFSELKERVPVP